MKKLLLLTFLSLYPCEQQKLKIEFELHVTEVKNPTLTCYVCHKQASHKIINNFCFIYSCRDHLVELTQNCMQLRPKQ
jgi:hypothetical protein